MSISAIGASCLIGKILEKKITKDEFIEPLRDAFMDYLISRKVLTIDENRLLNILIQMFRQKFDGTDGEFRSYIAELQDGEKY